MFKKPLAQQSNATPIRSSARRQLISAIFAQYPDLLTGKDEVEEKSLAKVIVPEGIRLGSFETSGGVEGTMYSNAEGDPLWMTLGRSSKEYIPTLYLLARTDVLPVLQIHNPLPPPLLTGAPLFIAALRNLPRPHLLPDVPEGGLVAFVTSEKNDLNVSYVGVGRVAAEAGVKGAVQRRIRKLNEDLDVEEGKFCDILCILNDHLWESGSKLVLPTFTLPQPVHPLVAAPEAGPSRPRTPDLSEKVAQVSISDKPSLSSSDISTLLNVALLQVLAIDPPTFPIPASQLYSSYILPNRPAYIPKDQREDVVIAKSEWKKLAKWMKEVSKDGVIKIKESKGEITVQSFDALHPSIQAHAPFLTIAQEERKAAKKAAREEEPTLGKGKQLAVEELWKPAGSGVPFWEAAGVDASALHSASALKGIFEEHVTKHSLVSPDHRHIILDDDLARAVGVKNPRPGEALSREETLRRLRAGVAWSVSIGGVVRKGALQPITMAVKTRQGRKTVTIVAGLETFGVDVDDFAEELRKLCAGSASIQPLTGASPKLNLQEIMVQGSQVKIITEALVAKGIPKRWIREEAGKKK